MFFRYIWEAWRDISKASRPLYERFVELGNRGARNAGYDVTQFFVAILIFNIREK